MCYKYVGTKNTWEGAVIACSDMGGELAVPSTASKNNFISSFTSDEFWIGGFKNDASGKWEWLDGSVWSYSSWLSNPQEPSGDGPFIVSNFGGIGNWWNWNDRPDKTHRAFVCQTSMTPSSPPSGIYNCIHIMHILCG